jgi:NCS1 family nucleobase:cation symporter-1
VNLLLEDVRAGVVEDGVPPERRTMSVDKVFWSHFCTNLAPVTWVLGALVAGLGLDFRAGLLALFCGNVLGALPVGLNATLGPRTGLTQIEISRFSFGRLGTRLPATFNWISAVGWDAVNNVPSVLAIVALGARFGLSLPFWSGLALLVAIQLTASIYGHHVVQLLAKYLCYVLIVVFAITGIVAVTRGGSFAAGHGPVSPAMFLLGVSMIAGFNIGFAPYSSDYTRYLPAGTKPALIFGLSAGGLIASGFSLELCGLLTASRLHDLSPAGVIAGIGALTGPFGPVALVAIAVSAVAINSINDNTAAYSLISTGVRVPRHVSAVVTSLCGFALAVAGAGKFAELFGNYLLLLLYWIAPWAGIVLADWRMYGGLRPLRAWGNGATIFAIVTPATIALFSTTEIYTGPVAKLLGGADVGFFVGFFVAAAAYVLAGPATPLLRRARRPRLEGSSAAEPGPRPARLGVRSSPEPGRTREQPEA